MSTHVTLDRFKLLEHGQIAGAMPELPDFLTFPCALGSGAGMMMGPGQMQMAMTGPPNPIGGMPGGGPMDGGPQPHGSPEQRNRSGGNNGHGGQYHHHSPQKP